MRPLDGTAAGPVWRMVSHRIPLSERDKVLYSLCVGVLVLLAGLMSGAATGGG